ncbi:GNAT family N-acetyltransferase [Paucibacter sp. PLA-PC-4]|uniref:GNAT family N-acetyltransferase n=1 Tax=Paucibacter sp. PLA-PC-4 TaxID=2993655 RepID=UPI002248BC6D|nr:GNAT family N-acetyltransferase [Paucibacter sp. PLA-PC-4]MCX2862074.1 GNAT family N-acetyltransferase [Paucibacter sp. PLA-PC-4]
MSVEVMPLYRCPGLIEPVARLIYEEFWREVEGGYSLADLVAHLRNATDPDRIPLSLIAVEDGELLGTINLIENDDAQRAHLRPWLAAMVVSQGRRGEGIGSALVRTLLAQAQHLGLPRLFLGTDGPGFYARLGAQLHEQVREDFCIMCFELGQRP